MTPDQVVNEIRKELAINERLAKLVQEAAKGYADRQLRDTYTQLDHASMLRLTGVAAGVESFAKLITESPSAARKTGNR